MSFPLAEELVQLRRLDRGPAQHCVRLAAVVDLVFEARRATTVAEVNEAIQAAAHGRLKGILGFTDQPNVSSDFNHDPHSSIFHLDQTKVMDGTMVRILTWYDNEWGFSNRMADTAVAMGKLI